MHPMRTTTATLAAFLLAPLPAQTPAPAAQPATLTLPAFTGYAHPDPNAMRRHDDGTVERCAGSLHFYVHFAQPGELTLRLERTDAADAADAANPQKLRTIVNATSAFLAEMHTSTTTDLGTFAVKNAGFHNIRLATTNGEPLLHLRALHLSGTAVANAHANVAERRNAASVHLGYPVPKEQRDDIAWFYIELTPKTDPLWTYYMATGWHRGYFGMQVNSPTERRVIFSVWDAGNEAIDRGKVAAQNRVSLVGKGNGVNAGDFGNEGTGGHSHLVHPWRLGATFRFLMHARVDGDATIYTGWFWFADKKEWGLIASFRAPKDGKLLHGLYSFSENFSGANGDAVRECEFANGWVRTTQGTWVPLHNAHFTHDETGEAARRDRHAGVRGERFYLHHGGFVATPTGAVDTARARLQIPERTLGKPPADPELPTPPEAPPAVPRDGR